jgi:hypothetical protein
MSEVERFSIEETARLGEQDRIWALRRDQMRSLITKLVNVPITSLATCLCRG